ncbi:hypothetical protein ACMFMG_003036 [Clarireedia jacksonii]
MGSQEHVINIANTQSTVASYIANLKSCLENKAIPTEAQLDAEGNYIADIAAGEKIRNMIDIDEMPLPNNFTTLDGQKLRLEYARACFLAVQQDALSEAINGRGSDTIMTGTDETITTETAKCNNTSMTDEATP